MGKERAKPRRNGMRAGKVFERRVARILRPWLGHGWTVARNQTDRQKGQLEGSAGEFTVEGPWEWPFSIECKDQAAFGEFQLWGSPVPGPVGSTPKSEGFWAQTVRQAQTVNRLPMLIFKTAGPRPILLAVDRDIGDRLSYASPRMELTVDGAALMVQTLRVFLDSVTPEDVRALAEIDMAPPPPPPPALL